MAVTSKNVQNDPPADKPVTDVELPAAPADKDRQAKIERRECVVVDNRPHMGRATPGALICSAHAMHYNSDGTPRR